jgi:hypothetical protein
MAASFYKWLLAGSFAFIHPFFVSVTEINHNAKDKTLEISCKMFLDDTEKILKKQGTPVELTNPKEPKKVQQLISSYIKKHLLVKIDGKAVILEFIGYEVEGASVWSYYQVNDIATVHKIDISNNILYELYDTQISIMHAQVAGNKKSTRITNPETSVSFEF